MELKVNPVKGLCMKNDIGLVGINDTCWGICASYSETNDPYKVDPKCAQACLDYVNKKKLEIDGKGLCGKETPFRPPIWEQYGRYFPKLLRKGMNPDTALQKCKQLCIQNSPLLSEECQDACLLDYNSLDSADTIVSVPITGKPVVVSPSSPIQKKISDTVSNNKPKFLLFTIMIAIILGLIKYSMF